MLWLSKASGPNEDYNGLRFVFLKKIRLTSRIKG